jgi:hypothetical protein
MRWDERLCRLNSHLAEFCIERISQIIAKHWLHAASFYQLITVMLLLLHYQKDTAADSHIETVFALLRKLRTTQKMSLKFQGGDSVELALASPFKFCFPCSIFMTKKRHIFNFAYLYSRLFSIYSCYLSIRDIYTVQ